MIRNAVLLLSLICLLAAGVLGAGFLVGVWQDKGEHGAAAAAPPPAEPPVQAEDGLLSIRAERRYEENGRTIYDGDADLRTGALRITCDRMQRRPSGGLFEGYGGVQVHGMPGYPGPLRADRFAFSAASGQLTLEGDVRLPQDKKTLRLRRAMLNDNGRIERATSLLDDFAASRSVSRRLALLGEIAEVYDDGDLDDSQLPPEATYLLAMRLLLPHLRWHAMEVQGATAGLPDKTGTGSEQTDPGPTTGSREVPVPVLAGNPGEAHCGEPWMHVDPRVAEYWRLGERWQRNPDLLRAVRLLRLPAADEAEADRRREWLTAIQCNNTVIRLGVLSHYPCSAAAPVVVDVRAADRLSVRLYRVSRDETWTAVLRRWGTDFVFRDKSQPAVTEAKRPAPALSADDLAYTMRVEVAELKAAAGSSSDAPHAGRPTAWRRNRLLEIPAAALKKPGRYVLAVEDGGQTAYAPIEIVAQTNGWGNAQVHRGVVYRDLGHRKLHMDIAVPQAAEPLPAIVLLPGGVYQQNSPGSLHSIMQFFAQYGYVTAAVEYRCPPGARFPDPLLDAKTAIGFLQAHAEQYRIDPRRMGLWGRSMGGGIALLAGMATEELALGRKKPPFEPSCRVRAIVDRYGPTDFASFPRNVETIALMTLALGTADPASPQLRRASPLSHIRNDSPPVLLLHCRKDRVVPFQQSEIFCEALRKAGVPTQLHEIAGENHGSEFHSQSDAARAASFECLRLELQWFDRYVKAP